MNSFLQFLRRVWAGLKAACTRKNSSNNNTVTIHTSEDTLVSEDIAEILKATKREAKAIARQKLADMPRVSRNKYREVLERETNSIFERILSGIGSFEPCTA